MTLNRVVRPTPPALAIGWAIHLFHGVVLGLLYGAAVSLSSLRSRDDGLLAGTVLGTVYGVVLGLVYAALRRWA